MSGEVETASLLLKLLEGSKFATAMRNNGRPCRIELPGSHELRRRLVEAHIQGTSETLTFCARDRDPWQEPVGAVVLAAYCPRADGMVSWFAFDLDGGDHGVTGLADPVHAARAIAERADHLGLAEGLLVARSRRAHGRHIFLILPEAIPLDDAVIGTAALAAHAYR